MDENGDVSSPVRTTNGDVFCAMLTTNGENVDALSIVRPWRMLTGA